MEETNPTDTTETTETTETTLLSDDTTETTETTEPTGGENTPSEPPKTEEPKSLLDDDDEGGEKPEEPKEANQPSDEDIQKFCEGIPALDLGDGVKWDDATLKAMAPSLMELTGNDPKKAQGVVKAYTQFAQAQYKAQMEAQNAFNNALIKECQNRYGEDLKKVSNLAKAGGKAIFGELWNEMKKIPAFANNPDILGKLAEQGKRFATDNGKVTPKDGASNVDEGDVLSRMYGNVSI